MIILPEPKIIIAYRSNAFQKTKNDIYVYGKIKPVLFHLVWTEWKRTEKISYISVDNIESFDYDVKQRALFCTCNSGT